MESIEKRAKELVKRILFVYQEGEYLDNMVKITISYLIDQRDIDTKEFMKESLEMIKAERERVKAEMIDKACEWLRVRNVMTEDSIKGFRKSMEE